MRPEDLYLQDILDAAEALSRFLEGVEERRFMSDELLQSAVLQKLIVIGEAASRIEQEFRSRHAEIEWREVIAFRNFAVHAYFAIEWSIVWITATEDVPSLCRQIGRLLDEGRAP